MIDAGEAKEDAVRRESIEESGYEPHDLQHLTTYYATPGGSSETIDLYLGYVDKNKPVTTGGGVDAEHEDIRTFWVRREQAVAWVKSGKINSGAPMLSVMLAFGMQGAV